MAADSDCIEIRWTCSSIDEGRRVARYLVQERLVACVQIEPWVESIYIWNRQLETTQESKVTLKTQRAHLDSVMRVILENSSYEIPEITYFTIEGGNSSYLEWVVENTSTINSHGS